MITLKSVDLSKVPSYVLKEMQKEVEIYKDLADIQGKYIPKLVCYGYYGEGISFVIGLTIVGTMLSDQKITEQQKSRAIKGLEVIHKHGILHNDIWEENILINDKDMQTKINLLKQHITKFEAELEAKNSEISELRKKLAKFKARDVKIHELRKKIAKVEAKNAELIKQMMEKNNRHDARIEILEKNKMDITDRVPTLEHTEAFAR
ncbi:hypothetical protein C1645_733356 [Glomus cerebriforme]|uniref:Protein kinase domain-containing protein n=1 Tax=Glomus cerebriforme TaxID=658196 RepID=A0A397TG76_9GLOM|nr:hypothetical protein C1645_733356 [Glomus cerebriforme]